MSPCDPHTARHSSPTAGRFRLGAGWRVGDRRRLSCAEKRVRTELRVMDVLVHPAAHKRTVVSRGELRPDVWHR